MATLTEQVIARAGVTPALVAAASGGDQFANAGQQYLEILNGGGSSITLTVVTQKTVDGKAVADDTVTVTAAGTRKVGPFPPSIYNDSNGNVQLAYSGVTSVTVGIFRMVNSAN